MSNRVLKKLHGDKDIASALRIEGLSESDDGGTSFRGNSKKPLNNRFELLNSGEHSLSDTEAKEDDDRENEPAPDGQERSKLEKQDSTHSTDSLKRKKKKKKKKLKSQKSTEENLDDRDDDLEACVRDVTKMFGEPMPDVFNPAAMPKIKVTPIKAHRGSLLSILSVDIRNLDPDNEMKKLFGAKVVQNEQIKKRGRGRPSGRTFALIPCNHKERYPHKRSGLSMELLETRDDIHYFSYEHNKQYQSIHKQFMEAVESSDPENIIALLNIYPYHIDALIQFSDICKMGDDLQTAALLIERAVHYMECAFHPLFHVAKCTNRLDYRRIENRSFFISLFKHTMYVGQRGCNRTALELCKFILSLDPENDPLAVILMIDNYALRSSDYEFLVLLYNLWNPVRNLFQLPNFAFSIALAEYFINYDTFTEDADMMLQDALIMYPGFLLPMLEKCGVEPDKKVLSHPFFRRQNDPKGLTLLIALYIAKTHSLWKSKNIIHWLEKQVHEVLNRYDAKDPIFEQYENKRKIRYLVTPLNVLRHVILSDVRDSDLVVELPPEMSRQIFSFDPLPPPDSISPYEKRNQTLIAPESQGVYGMFFVSLLPGFNTRRENNNLQFEAGARGGQEAAQNDLRQSVASLIDAVRELLSSVQIAEGEDMPNEADVDSDDDTREA